MTKLPISLLLFAGILFTAGSATAQTDSPSAKWVSDTRLDVVQAYNLTGSLWEAFQNDPSLIGPGTSLQALGNDLRNTFYPEVTPFASKTALRAYVDQTLMPQASAVLSGLHNSIVPKHPELLAEAQSLENWLNILVNCVHSDSGNGHDND